MADASALQIIWSGISGLLGAVIGAGATPSWQTAKTTSRSRRQRFVLARARSRTAVSMRALMFSVLGQLLTDEANILWYNPATNESEERNRGSLGKVS